MKKSRPFTNCADLDFSLFIWHIWYYLGLETTPGCGHKNPDGQACQLPMKTNPSKQQRTKCIPQGKMHGALSIFTPSHSLFLSHGGAMFSAFAT